MPSLKTASRFLQKVGECLCLHVNK